MKLKSIILAIAFVCFAQVNAQDQASSQKNNEPTASQIMKKAYKEAKKSNKKVLLMFHASWCGWCKRMDKQMQDPAVKEYFDRSFVTTHLTVMESPKNKHLENKGAMDIMKKFKADKGGIPFWVIFNKRGKALEESRDDKGSNLGCPASEPEVAKFLEILKNTTKMTQKEADAVAKVFTIKR